MKHLFSFGIVLILTTASAFPSFIEPLFDGLNFNYAREIALSIDKPTLPIELHYKLRWGYQGAGNRATPFTGISGHLKLNFNYDGLSFQVRKSQSLAPTMNTLLYPIEWLNPCQEFYLKFFQLVWTTGQQKNPDASIIQTALETMIARLKLTPDGDQCMLYKLPALSTPERIGFSTYLEQNPAQCVAHFITLSQKSSAALALITGQIPDDERLAYFQAFLEQTNYFDQTCIVQFPGEQLLIMPFNEAGAGSAQTPLLPMKVTLIMPASETVTHPTEWTISLTAEQAGLLRCITLLIHNRREHLPLYVLIQEISTLCSRLSITPTADGQPSMARIILGFICNYHQSIINYSFDTPLNTILDTAQFCLQLCRVAYHATIMQAKPQEITDFVTLHTAHAIRWYQGFIALTMITQQKAQLNNLTQKGIVIDWELFIKTLIIPVTI
jgi:hypothetical protein